MGSISTVLASTAGESISAIASKSCSVDCDMTLNGREVDPTPYGEVEGANLAPCPPRTEEYEETVSVDPMRLGRGTGRLLIGMKSLSARVSSGESGSNEPGRVGRYCCC